MFYPWIVDLLRVSAKTGQPLSPGTVRILIGYLAGRGCRFELFALGERY